MDPNQTPPPNPYAAPQAAVSDVAVDTVGELASPWLRLGGYIIDLLILMVVVSPVYFMLFWSAVSSGQQPGFLTGLGFSVFVFIVFVALQGYFLNQSGQTIAKKLLKMKIVDENGNKPEFVKLIGLRYGVVQLAQIVPFLGFLYAIVDALFIFRDDRRRISDLLAGTRVVMTE
ncbi:RDD family protein [Aquimonas voraii]|uniref:Uncharacterized membrane protein YckC, RDD family n=1 Tax=Aquimonas voraii TaxID=265719 RepID=A0A1G6SHA8_9GAMM|nr:RDD family protein [Aquimonas voraii]SDD15557.1 Uncharacterized membrane protein YckC, RDD family [Aquimonas voraii]